MGTAAEIVIRPGTPDDLPQLVDIDREVRQASNERGQDGERPEPDPAGRLRDWIVAGECYVATIGDLPVGYAVLHYHFFHSGFIEMVIVEASYRRRGIGCTLVRYLADRCTSKKVWTSTNLSNTRMQSLLAGEDFAMCGFIEGLDKGDPELFYSRPAHKR